MKKLKPLAFLRVISTNEGRPIVTHRTIFSEETFLELVEEGIQMKITREGKALLRQNRKQKRTNES